MTRASAGQNTPIRDLAEIRAQSWAQSRITLASAEVFCANFVAGVSPYCFFHSCESLVSYVPLIDEIAWGDASLFSQGRCSVFHTSADGGMRGGAIPSAHHISEKYLGSAPPVVAPSKG